MKIFFTVILLHLLLFRSFFRHEILNKCFVALSFPLFSRWHTHVRIHHCINFNPLCNWLIYCVNTMKSTILAQGGWVLSLSNRVNSINIFTLGLVTVCMAKQGKSRKGSLTLRRTPVYSIYRERNVTLHYVCIWIHAVDCQLWSNDKDLPACSTTIMHTYN